MKKLLILVATLAVFSSCLKIKQDPQAPVFDVTTPKTTYAVGDSVLFTMTGNPDYITFFSGEQGLNYNNINRFTAAGVPKLQFTSTRANGTQANSLQLMVSSDFIGLGVDSTTTAANIAAATWTDITSRATLSTGAAVASGAIDLSDFAAQNKPVFIAFKYNGATGSIQNKWTISALTLTNTLPDGSVYTIANLTATAITNYGVATLFSQGWVPFRLYNTANWVVTSGTSLVVTGASTVATATTAVTDWTFTGPINLSAVSNDVGVPIKESSTRLASNIYPYIYKAPGTYVVTFVAANSNIYGQKETVKQITLTVH